MGADRRDHAGTGHHRGALSPGTIPLILGAAVILACEVLLFIDVARRGVAVLPPMPGETAGPPEGALGHLARWVAVNLTPLCWAGFLLFMHGLLERLRSRGGPGSPARTRPRRFWVCFVTGVGVWCFFDWINFSFIRAWFYWGLEPLSLGHVLVAKFVAFGAISPAMFMCAELYQHLGLRRARTRGLPLGAGWQVATFAVGVPAFLVPFIVRDPIACFSLWVSLVLLLDPLVHWFGRDRRRTPSLIGDLQAGRWGRSLSLMAGGLTCGFLWEFWNYWAAAKWVYTLPFLGPTEAWRLFEMPWLGFGGFLPFALECWVAFQFILLVVDRLGLRFVEPLGKDHDVL